MWKVKLWPLSFSHCKTDVRLCLCGDSGELLNLLEYLVQSDCVLTSTLLWADILFWNYIFCPVVSKSQKFNGRLWITLSFIFKLMTNKIIYIFIQRVFHCFSFNNGYYIFLMIIDKFSITWLLYCLTLLDDFTSDYTDRPWNLIKFVFKILSGHINISLKDTCISAFLKLSIWIYMRF